MHGKTQSRQVRGNIAVGHQTPPVTEIALANVLDRFANAIDGLKIDACLYLEVTIDDTERVKLTLASVWPAQLECTKSS